MLAADSRYDSVGDEIFVAALITHNDLKEIVRASQIVIGGDPTAVEGIKYDFRFGSKNCLSGQVQRVLLNEIIHQRVSR